MIFVTLREINVRIRDKEYKKLFFLKLIVNSHKYEMGRTQTK